MFNRTKPGRLYGLVNLPRRSRDRNQEAVRALAQPVVLGDRMALTRVLGRFKMYVDPLDLGIAPHLMLDGYWEMWLTEAIAARVKPGMKCVDIGANIGYFTLLFAELVGRGGSVHGFEPDPESLRYLRQSVAINGYASRVRLHEAALGERDDTLRLVAPERDRKNAYLSSDAKAEGVDVEVRRYDAHDELIDADFIKIDIEGSEEAAWEGMRGFLESGRSVTVALEFAAARYTEPGRFVRSILEHGFAISVIDPDAGTLPLDAEGLLARPANEDQMLLLTR